MCLGLVKKRGAARRSGRELRREARSREPLFCKAFGFAGRG